MHMTHRETVISHFIVRVPVRIETALESRKQMEEIERQADLLKGKGQISVKYRSFWSYKDIFVILPYKFVRSFLENDLEIDLWTVRIGKIGNSSNKKIIR